MKNNFLDILKIIPGSTNIVLRILSIVGKFLFTMYLIRYLTTHDLGVYSIFTTTVTIGSYILGIEFYTFSNREIMASIGNKKLISLYVQDQFLLYMFTYLFFFPTIIVVVFYFGILSWNLLWYFLVILATFHIAQELQRLLISISHPVIAIIIGTLGSGIWVYPAMILGLLFPWARTIDFSLFIWSGFGIISCILGLKILHRRNIVLFSPRKPNWRWIMRGFSSSIIFFCYTILYLATMKIDYYILLFVESEAEVGILSFFSNIAMILVDFVTVGVSINFLPKLVETYHQNRLDDYRKVSREFLHHTLKSTLILLPSFIFGIHVITYFTENKELSSNIIVYYIFLLTSFVICVSMSFHYQIYAQRRDTSILLIIFLGFIIKVVFCLVLIPKLGILGASLATLISFTFVSFIEFSVVIFNSNYQSRRIVID